jgi:hypothetical protein
MVAHSGECPTRKAKSSRYIAHSNVKLKMAHQEEQSQ